jgi:tetratricopeptide (TPR) repeat protein
MRSALVPMLLAALLAVPATAPADTVTLPDKMELSGKKVEILEIRDKDILVRVAYGDLVVARTRVLAMKVDFPERLASLKEQGADTPRALYNLGRVCSQLEMPKEAATAYREAFARKDVPDDLFLPLGAELERCEDWAAAHQCYAAYLKLHPDSADAAAKARATAAKAAQAAPVPETPPPSDVKIDSTLPATTSGTRPVRPANPAEMPKEAPPAEAPKDPDQPAEQPKEQEGLEARAGWTTEAWGSSVEINVGPPQGTTDKMVRVFLAGAEQDKACVMLEEDFDLTNKKTLSFDVYNFAKNSITVGVAFTTNPGWKFYEGSPAMVMPTGNNPKPVTVDLTSEKFKSAETQWRHKTPIQNKNRVVKFYFLLYTKQTNAWVFFNNVRFEPADGAAAAAEPPAPAPAPGPAPKGPAPGPAPAPAPGPDPKAPAAPAPAPAPAPKAPAPAPEPAPAPKAPAPADPKPPVPAA